MQTIQRVLFFMVSVMILPCVVMSSALAVSPQGLYDEVWKIVDNRYVDEYKNHQDWRIWRHRYDTSLKTPEDAYVAIETMVSSLGDRYTRFLDPEEFSEETRGIQAKLFGIGVQIGVKDDKIMVIAPMEGTPAEKAGLKAGDEITSIDGKPTKGLSIKDASKFIRGDKGTYVKVGVLRDNQDLTFNIVRDEITLKSVSVVPPLPTDLPAEVGYVKLSTFLSKTAASELKEILIQYKDKQALILDLRSNPGGLLTNAVFIADFFLKGGAIVSTVDRHGYKVITHATNKQMSAQPLVVLIDEGSASASEILAGALKDHQRAILVGEKSFGKGLVQEINPLSDGAGFNVTTQRYLTPNDTDIHKKGITPDYKVPVKKEDILAKRDVQLLKALEVVHDDFHVNFAKSASSSPSVQAPASEGHLAPTPAETEKSVEGKD
ncbi:MAG: S41 family peptidase [Vampirovibrio sp.]